MSKVRKFFEAHEEKDSKLAAWKALEELEQLINKQSKLIELYKDLVTELSSAEYAQRYEVINYLREKIREVENDK